LADTSSSDIPEPFLRVYTTALSEDWIYFGGGEKQNYWFLPRTIRKTPQGTSTVWSVHIQGADSTGSYTSARDAIIARFKRMGTSTMGYERYLQTKVQWEVDCVHQRIRIIQLLDYNEDGELLHSGKTKAGLEDPVPGSNGEGLLRVFCNPTLRKTFRMMMEP
jgi:hypothetical protein